MSAKDAETNAKAEAIFELNHLSAPTLSGPSLWLFALLIESNLFGTPLRRQILQNSGFIAYRERAAIATSDAAIRGKKLPIHFPLPPPPPSPPTLSDIDTLFHSLPKISSATRPTIHDYHAAYKSGRTTPTKVAQALLRLIATSNRAEPPLNAVICVQAEDVLAEAAACTGRWREGRPLSVLDGVPYTVKIHMDVENYPTHSCSNFLRSYAEARRDNDADVVKALREAGMIMVGKTNMDELGVGVRGFSMFTGQTRNPHDADYVPGGSSGGGGAAVAAGLCPVSIGSDAGGSIRIPAALCGVYGLKGTFGRISTFGRALSDRDENDKVLPVLHFGPLTGCATDLVVMYYVLAAFAPHRKMVEEPRFEPCREIVPRGVESGVGGLRVGVCLPWMMVAEEGLRGAMRRFVDGMVRDGAVEVAVAVPDLEDVRVSVSVGIMKEVLGVLKKKGYYGGGGGKLGYDARGKLRMGEEFTEGDLRRAEVVREKAMRFCEEVFEEVDVIVTPAVAVGAPKVPGNLRTGLVDVGADSRLMTYCVFGNVTGVPACVVPVAGGEGELPVGVQVMAPFWAEERLLRVCLWAEGKVGGSGIVPKWCYNAIEDGGEVEGG